MKPENFKLVAFHSTKEIYPHPTMSDLWRRRDEWPNGKFLQAPHRPFHLRRALYLLARLLPSRLAVGNPWINFNLSTASQNDQEFFQEAFSMVFLDTPGKVLGPINLPNKNEGTEKEMSRRDFHHPENQNFQAAVVERQDFHNFVVSGQDNQDEGESGHKQTRT